MSGRRGYAVRTTTPRTRRFCPAASGCEHRSRTRRDASGCQGRSPDGAELPPHAAHPPAPARPPAGATRMTAPGTTVAAMIEGSRADTGSRRQRVLAALADAAKSGSEASVTAIARRAGVDRTFLHRHRDLLGQVHAQEAEPTALPGGRGPAVSRAPLQADLPAADARTLASPARSGASKHGSAKCWATMSAASPASAVPGTANSSGRGSPPSNSRSSTWSTWNSSSSSSGPHSAGAAACPSRPRRREDDDPPDGVGARCAGRGGGKIFIG